MDIFGGMCKKPFDILPMPKGRGFWIQAEIANNVGLISPSPRVDAPTLKIIIMVPVVETHLLHER